MKRYRRPASLLALSLALAVLLAWTFPAAASPEVPGAEQRQPIALVGATVHPVSGPAIENGTIIFDGGKLVAVGDKVEIPDTVQRIDVSGLHVYPGLIDAGTELGLVEIGAVRATRDLQETGLINPNVCAEVAVNPDSELIPVARSNGILTAVTQPQGGLIRGTSAVIHLDGWTYEDMTLRAPAALHITWPRMVPRRGWWVRTAAEKQLKERDERLEKLRRAFADARAYRQAKSAAESGGLPPEFDARWEAMVPVLDGEVPLVVHANEIQQIQSAVAFAEREGVKLIVYGGYDAPHCAKLLKEHDVPVIVGGVHRLPMRRDEPYDEAFTVPARLAEAGVRFCIASDTRASNVRNLPYHAVTAAAYGLSPEQALRSVTLSAAEILGIADAVGSLEPEKDATLIVTTGDPLETATQVEMAFIQGRRVDLSDRHKRLWRKYQQKYRRLEAAE